MILFLWWQAIELKLAFHITERGLVVDWIGARITIQADWSVRVAFPDKMVTELLSECNEMLELRTVGLRRLRKFVGRCSWAAGLVQELAPFLASFGRRSLKPWHKDRSSGRASSSWSPMRRLEGRGASWTTGCMRT